MIAVRNYNPTWTRNEIIRVVRGQLVANNEIDGTTHGFTVALTTLDAITFETLAGVFTQIQQSNADILITDIEWSFIIDINTIRVGAAKIVKQPKWVKKLNFRVTWQSWGVNCGAFALNYLKNFNQRNYKDCTRRAVEDATALQEEMGWDEIIRVHEIGKFVEVYDEYRIVVIEPSILQTPPNNIFTGKKWVPNSKDLSKTLYLVYDGLQKHFGATKTPGQLFNDYQNTHTLSWCHSCCFAYRTTQGHEKCDDCPRPKKKPKKLPACQNCNVFPGKEKHVCPLVTCSMCSTIYKKAEGFDHRCIVLKEPRKEEKNTFCKDKEKADGTLFSLWVYDFESRIQIQEHNREMIVEYRTEGVHYADTNVCVYDKKIHKHEVNFVCCRNVFTDEEECFFGDGALQEFISFLLSYNKGKNICIAHNASGYDARLLFSKVKDMRQQTKIGCIMRGGKFMQLIVNKTLIFRDSLLHVKGSLKNLAKDFCDGLLEKGYFPHLFNSTENYGYVGRIPEKKFFDLSFSVRSQPEMDNFNVWYDTWTGKDDWDFDSELRKYCRNDVHVLQKIVKGYHDVAFDKFGMSPWFNATAPSFVHEVFLIKLGQELELPDRKENLEEYKTRLQELARDEYWAVLKPNEYWFARKALRGGRTDIRKCLHVVSDEEWARGVRIRYQDICSQYPYQQVVHDFPVGTPLIHTWDYKYAPCIKHQNSQSIVCSCVRQTFIKDRFCDWVPENEQWTAEQILAKKDFFGIVCASLDPPKNMFHPVLVVYDETLGKSIASCRPIIEGCFTSVEFITALENGYTLKKIHRYDQYNKKPSLWRDIVLDLFLEKMINSKNAPTGEKAQKLIQDYGDLFGEDFAEKIDKSIQEGKWGKHPAKKQTAKIMMNSAWGKHAQRPIMPEVEIYNTVEQTQDIQAFFDNCAEGNYQLHTAKFLNATDVMYTISKTGEKTTPDLHGGYLPAALFVPAYGRLQLWKQLNMLGKRVLMNDTDSIIYLYDPDLENIPEGGLIGEWEVEDEDSKYGGIREFVGLGPKTYGFKCAEKDYSKVKAKGLSLNLATEKLVNFQTMKQMAVDYLAGKKPHIKVPQKTFTGKVGEGLHTFMMMKILRMDLDSLKGTMNDEGYIFPLGYEDE